MFLVEELIALYTHDEINRHFNEQKLFDFLLNQAKLKSSVQRVKNGRILNLRSSDETIFFIEKGIVSISVDETILYFKGVGRFVGLESLLFHDSNDLEFSAVGEVEVLEFKKVDIIDALMNMQEGWLYGYLINVHLQELLVQQYMFSKMRTKKRSKELLKVLAKEISNENESLINLPKQLNYTVLTKYLGVSYVTIRKLFEEFRKESFIIEGPNRSISINLEI